MHREPSDPKARLSRLFGEDVDPGQPESGPFADRSAGSDPVGHIRESAIRLRRVRAQIGSEGLSPAGTRALLDEVIRALEAAAEGLERMSTPPAADDG